MTKYDFDDILIKPYVLSDIESRYADINLPYYLPLFTAPMDTVVDLTNFKMFNINRIVPVLPRTIDKTKCFPNYFIYAFISYGLQEIQEALENDLANIPLDTQILIDVANGHMSKIISYCKQIKKLRSDITIMVGNIANPQTYKSYAEAECVDFIRIGIGNGGGCLTTKQSGIGFPMASLIRETYLAKLYIKINNPDLKLPKIVADGGMKDYADIIKALALGADYVMLGSILNKAIESCAPNYWHGIKVGKHLGNWLFSHGFTIKKYFRGMSTKGAQKAMGKTKFKTSEGITRFRKAEYSLSGWVRNFEHYLRNAMSYSNCKTLEEFIGNVEIIEITPKAFERFNK